MSDVSAKPTPDAAFDADVPVALRDGIFQEMSEAVAENRSQGRVSIVDHDQIDAVNCRASGFVTVDDKEYQFEMEDGNNRGTVLLSWDEDKPFVRHVPDKIVLQPARDIVAKAVESLTGDILLMKWDGMLKNQPKLAGLCDRYVYDRRVQPGLVTDASYVDEAARAGFIMVPERDAAETRRMLKAAVKKKA
jgi:hypothetical protein